MSLYKGNNLISGAMPNSANQSLSNLDSAGQDKFDAKANTNLNNLTSTSSTNFDGQWVASELRLANAVTAPTVNPNTYDLSAILPNDGYNYELILDTLATTGNTSGNTATVAINALNLVVLCATQTRTASTVIVRGAGNIIIGTNRKLQVLAFGTNTGTYSLYLRAYRRIGTNA